MSCTKQHSDDSEEIIVKLWQYSLLPDFWPVPCFQDSTYVWSATNKDALSTYKRARQMPKEFILTEDVRSLNTQLFLMYHSDSANVSVSL